MKLPKKKYYITPEKGTVVAKYSVPILPFKVVLDNSTLSPLEKSILFELHFNSSEGNKMLNDFASIAKCQEGDEFNADDGIDIAGIKCDMKYHNAVAGQCRNIIDFLRNLTNKVSEIEAEHHEKVCRIENDLTRHYGWEERTGI